MFCLGSYHSSLINLDKPLFKLFIQPNFDYCSTLFLHFTNASDKKLLESCYNKSINKLLKINIKNCDLSVQHQTLTKHFKNILPLPYRLFYHFTTFSYSIYKFNTKLSLTRKLTKHGIQTRSTANIPLFYTDFFKFSFSVISIKIYNLFLYNNLSYNKTHFKLYLLSNIEQLFSKSVNFWT